MIKTEYVIQYRQERDTTKSIVHRKQSDFHMFARLRKTGLVVDAILLSMTCENLCYYTKVTLGLTTHAPYTTHGDP